MDKDFGSVISKFERQAHRLAAASDKNFGGLMHRVVSWNSVIHLTACLISAAVNGADTRIHRTR
jgi:hypothetical protein